MFFLCEENLVVVLVWELSLLTHFLHHQLEIDSVEASQTSQQPPIERKNPKEDELNSFLKTDEWVSVIAKEVIDDIVMLVSRECEERTEIVDAAVSDLISMFTQSADSQSHSVEEERFIRSVADELIDGIVSTLSQSPLEKTLTNLTITPDLQYALNACELVILAISKMIMVGGIEFD